MKKSELKRENGHKSTRRQHHHAHVIKFSFMFCCWSNVLRHHKVLSNKRILFNIKKFTELHEFKDQLLLLVVGGII